MSSEMRAEEYDIQMAKQHAENMKKLGTQNPQNDFDAIIAQAKAGGKVVEPTKEAVPIVPHKVSEPKPAAKKTSSKKKSVADNPPTEDESMNFTASDAFGISAKNHDSSIDEYILGINDRILREAENGGYSVNVRFSVASNDFVNIHRILDWYRVKGFDIQSLTMDIQTTRPGLTETIYEFRISWVAATIPAETKKSKLVCG